MSNYRGDTMTEEAALDFIRLAMESESIEPAKIDAVIKTLTDTFTNHPFSEDDNE